MADEGNSKKKKRAPSKPRPLFLLVNPTKDESGAVTDFEIIAASRNAAVVLEKLDEANDSGQPAKLKKVMVE